MIIVIYYHSYDDMMKIVVAVLWLPAEADRPGGLHTANCQTKNL